jgi:hypothetical protein
MTSGETFAVIPRGGKMPGNSGTVNYYNPQITIYSGKTDPKKTLKGFV